MGKEKEKIEKNRAKKKRIEDIGVLNKKKKRIENNGQTL